MNGYDFRKAKMNDIFLHVKTESTTFTGENNQNYTFPITRYENILGRPRVTKNLLEIYGSPFVFFQEGEIELSDTEYEILFSKIF